MPAKQLKFGDDARESMARGASLLSLAVKATLGPRGRNVVDLHLKLTRNLQLSLIHRELQKQSTYRRLFVRRLVNI